MKNIVIILLCVIFSLGGIAANPPARVVSLAPSLTRSMYYLDARDMLKGVTTYCHIAEKDNKEIVATAVTVNVEKVILLRPDLVITTAMTHPETIALLRQAGIRTEVFPTPRSFDEICSQFLHLGSLTGKEPVADSIVTSVRKEVAAIRAKHRFPGPTTVFFQIGAKPLFTVLENTFMNDYITFLGARNIAEGFTRGTITREFILMKNPDVIIIVNMGITGEEEKKNWENYPFLNAVKRNRILFVESDMASTPNPPDFLKTLQAITRQLD
jgi:ABC-type Fe3+-hydroxamate transport system substrate-binding protein